MKSLMENSLVIQKTEELCEAILSQPEYAELQKKITDFIENDEATEQYHKVVYMQSYLQKKKKQGEMTEEHVVAYEKERDILLNNPIASNFFDAQEEIDAVQRNILQYVSKTFELGRVPTAEELVAGCGCGCGDGGCGCSTDGGGCGCGCS